MALASPPMAVSAFRACRRTTGARDLDACALEGALGPPCKCPNAVLVRLTGQTTAGPDTVEETQ
jgi:hypothetical protein